MVAENQYLKQTATTESTLVLGDDLYLEASMARRGGAVAGIVLTGMTTRERLADIPGDEMPEIVVESMTELAALFTDADELRMPVSTGLKR